MSKWNSYILNALEHRLKFGLFLRNQKDKLWKDLQKFIIMRNAQKYL